MIKNKVFFLLVIIMTVFYIGDSVNALSFSETISANSCKNINVDFIDTAHPFVYSKVVVNYASKKYTIGFFGIMNASSYHVIGTSVTLSGIGNIYILPRSGMGCPSDRKYCFGVGQPLTNTKIANSNDCTSAGVSSYCNIYGVRICNKQNSDLYIDGNIYLYKS